MSKYNWNKKRNMTRHPDGSTTHYTKNWGYSKSINMSGGNPCMEVALGEEWYICPAGEETDLHLNINTGEVLLAEQRTRDAIMQMLNGYVGNPNTEETRMNVRHRTETQMLEILSGRYNGRY